MIFNFFRKETEQEKRVNELYGAIVAQARQPIFYLEYAVPDDVNGRFEMIVLHAYMLFHRLRNETETGRELGQQVFDRFFLDMDYSLRERGIGDLSVPKKIKKMAQAFYGRVDAYDKAREAGGQELAEALSRNFYPDEEEPRDEAATLAAYVEACTGHLAAIRLDALLEGKLTYAAIPHHNPE